MSLIDIIKESKNIYTKMDFFINFLKGEGLHIAEKNLDYLGSGANGDVYNIKNSNRVLKIEKYNNLLYELIQTIKETQSNNVVDIFYLKHFDQFIITVMEKLEPSESHIKISHKGNFNNILLSMESVMTPQNPYYYKNRKGAYKFLFDIERFDSDLLTEFKETFTIGDHILQDIMGVVLLKVYHILKDNNLKECINNKEIIIDTYYGLRDIHDNGGSHGDVHIDNIMYDTKTNNFKLIDPWVI